MLESVHAFLTGRPDYDESIPAFLDLLLAIFSNPSCYGFAHLPPIFTFARYLVLRLLPDPGEWLVRLPPGNQEGFPVQYQVAWASHCVRCYHGVGVDVPEALLSDLCTVVFTQTPNLLFSPDDSVFMEELYYVFSGLVILHAPDFFTGETPIRDVMTCIHVIDVLQHITASGETVFDPPLLGVLRAYTDAISGALRRRPLCLASLEDRPDFPAFLEALILSIPALLRSLPCDQYRVSVLHLVEALYELMPFVTAMGADAVRAAGQCCCADEFDVALHRRGKKRRRAPGAVDVADEQP
jgi:hypothetical protein